MVLVDANVGIGHRCRDGGLLDQPIEQYASRPRGASVEAEGKFVEIVVHMPGINRAVMGAEQPTLEQSRDTVNARQWLVRRNLGSEDDVRIVIESFVRQRSENRRSIGAHPGAWRDVFAHERQERIQGWSPDAAQSNSSKAFTLAHFDSHGNSDRHSYCDLHAHTHSDSYSHGDAYTDSHVYSDTNSHSYGNANWNDRTASCSYSTAPSDTSASSVAELLQLPQEFY